MAKTTSTPGFSVKLDQDFTTLITDLTEAMKALTLALNANGMPSVSNVTNFESALSTEQIVVPSIATPPPTPAIPIASPVQAPPLSAAPITPVQTPPLPTTPVQPQAIPFAPTMQQNSPPATMQTPAMPTASPSYSIEQLMRAGASLMDKGINTLQLLQSFGVQAITELPLEQYGSFATMLRQYGAQI